MYFIISSVYSFSRFLVLCCVFFFFNSSDFSFFCMKQFVGQYYAPSSDIRLLCGTVLLEQNIIHLCVNLVRMYVFWNVTLIQILQILYARVTLNVFKRKKKIFPVCTHQSRWIVFFFFCILKHRNDGTHYGKKKSFSKSHVVNVILQSKIVPIFTQWHEENFRIKISKFNAAISVIQMKI